MGISLHITALVDDTDATYVKHKNVLLACIAAKIRILPIETADFFGSKYVDISIIEQPLERKIETTKYCTDYCEGFEINMKDIPPEVTKLRFVISY